VIAEARTGRALDEGLLVDIRRIATALLLLAAIGTAGHAPSERIGAGHATNSEEEEAGFALSRAD
jgi:hypothetical protein